MNKDQSEKLNQILGSVWDISFRERIIKIFEYLDVQDGDYILDCGCGEGFYSMILKELFNCKVVAFDLDAELIEKAKQNIGKGKVSFQQGDVTKLPFADKIFDKIILTEVLEHVPADSKAIKEIYRVLKKKGVVAVTVPNQNYPLFWDPLNKIREGIGLGHFDINNGFFGGIWAMHLRLYTPAQIIELVQENSDFEISRVEGLIRYCFPFYHNLLWSGRQIYLKTTFSKSIYSSMEKFDWKKKNTSLTSKMVRTVLSLINYPGNFGRSTGRHEKKSMCIALRLIK